VFGRDLKLVSERNANFSSNDDQVRALVEQDEVFAAMPMLHNDFAGAERLVEAGIPTFGWNIQSQWSLGPNLFGEKGSYLCFASDEQKCEGPQLPYLAKSIGADKVAIIAYGGVPQSASCAEGQKASYEKYGIDVAVEITSVTYGFNKASVAPDVERMRDEGVEFVSTCIEINGLLNLASAVKDAGLDDVKFHMPEGYDEALLEQSADAMEGFTYISFYRPFFLTDQSEGLTKFVDAARENGYPLNEQLLVGWLNADLLVKGIEAAGESFDRAKVIAAINEITDWTADGIYPDPGIDWTIAHEQEPPLECGAIITVSGGEWVLASGDEETPFTCFPNPAPDELPEDPERR
jgi:hypothetical protein